MSSVSSPHERWPPPELRRPRRRSRPALAKRAWTDAEGGGAEGPLAALEPEEKGAAPGVWGERALLGGSRDTGELGSLGKADPHELQESHT